LIGTLTPVVISNSENQEEISENKKKNDVDYRMSDSNRSRDRPGGSLLRARTFSFTNPGSDFSTNSSPDTSTNLWTKADSRSVSNTRAGTGNGADGAYLLPLSSTDG